MDEKKYIIEILLEARERVSQVAQRVAQQLDKVTKAEEGLNDVTRRMTATQRQQYEVLQQLVAAHTREKKALEDSTAVLRFRANALKANADASRKSLEDLQKLASVEKATANEREKRDIEELARLRLEIAEREALTAVQDKQFKSETAGMRKDAALLDALAKESSAANKRRASELDLQIAQRRQDTRESARAAQASESAARVEETSAKRVSRALDTHTKSLERVISSARGADRSTSRFGQTLQRLGIQSDGTRSSLRGLNAEFQGFQLAVAIKYAQSLLSALIALGAQLVAVAAAAGQAAVGLSAAFGAAAAQAIPVVGVLAAAFGRLTAVLKAVKLQNQQQLTDTHNSETSARRQASAADSIRNAQQQVADAHRNVARARSDLARTEADAARQEVQAQNDVTRARKDAIRTVQDLIAAEHDAQVQLLQAQASLRGSIQSGDVLGTLAAFDARASAQQGVTRARQDAAPVRARGVEGVDAVQQSEKRLTDVRRTNAQQIASATQQVADAQRQSRRAEQDLNRTRVEATQNISQETAAVDKLKDSLKLLSPAERRLYRDILELQKTYRRVSRPITDILTNAFGSVVERVNKLLQNPQILRGFHDIAVQIGKSIRQGTNEATGPQSVSFFETLQREAARNIPIITRIITNLFRTVRSLIIDALPAFRELLRFVGGYASALRDAVESHPQQITDFFVSGVKTAESFFKLALAVIKLLLAIAGPGGAADEGRKTIDQITGAIDDLTAKARAHAGQIRHFFAQTRDAAAEVIGVLVTLATTLAGAFNVKSVKTLADFLNEIIIPAVGSTIKLMGLLVNAFHQFLALPGVSEVAKLAATFLLMAKGLDIIRHAVSSITGIFPAFLRGFGLMAAEGEAAEGAFLGLGIAAGGWVVIIVGAVIGAIILLDRHFHFLGATFKWLKGAASDAFDWIVQAAKDTVQWFKDVWSQGLLYWVRAPFIALGKIFGHSSLFHSIIDDAKAVIDFFSGPAWAYLKAIVILPFEAARVAIDVIWGLIKSIVVVSLDIISGRFSRIGPQLSAIWSGIWDGIRGALVTALNALIGILNSAIDDINKISPFGDIGHIGKVSDDTQKKVTNSTDKMADQYDKVGDKASDNADRVGSAMEDISKSTDKAARDSAKSFDQLFQSAHVSLKDISQVTRINMENIVSTLGKNSAAGKEALAENFRQAAAAVKKQMDAGEVSTKNGMRAIRGYLADELQTYGLSIRQARTLANARAAGDTTTSFIGGPEEGTRGPGRAGGGMVSGYGGWPRDDHMVMDPYGRVSAMVSGNEGIVNPPQMDRINRWGAIVKSLGLDSYGSLQEMWGMRGGGQLRRFASGGRLQLPASFRATHQTSGLAGYPAIDVFGNPGTPVGSPVAGTIARFSGRPPSAGAYMGPGGPFGYSIYLNGTNNSSYFLTHFGSRSVRVGERVSRGQTLGTIGDYPGSVPDHIHEGLHGGLTGIDRQSGAGTPAARLIRSPRVIGGGAVGALVNRVLRLSTTSANRLVRAGAGQGTDFTGEHVQARGADANVVAAFRRAMNAMHANRTERLAGWEAGIVESGLRNLQYGDRDSLGSLQERTGIYGRAHALNPYASMIRFLRDAISKRPWRGSAGSLAQSVQRSGFPLRYDAVSGQAASYLRNGGPLRRLQRGGLLSRAPGVAPAFTQINTALDGVASALEPLARAGGRARGLALRIGRAFALITGDGGLLDQLSTAVESIATRGALALQRLQFHVRGGVARRTYLAPEQLAQANVRVVRATGTGLQQEGATIQGDLATAQEQLAIAQARGNKRAQTVARAAIAGLRTRLEKNTADIAQNAQDQVEAQEAFQQARLDSVNEAATQQNDAIDRWSRVAKAFGHTIDPNVVLGSQISNMQRQIGGLQGVLNQAMKTGNLDLAKTVRGQIDELNTQIAEAVAQQFQNSIDAVNNQAQSAITVNDRVARRAQIGGTNYAALGGSLVARGNILAGQRAGLAALLAQAQASGNVDQVKNLTDQIDELDTAMAENTQAVKDNTDAAFNALTQAINDRASFSQTVFGGAQGFFQALTTRTGINTTPQQTAALRGLGQSLTTQQGGLKERLGALLGYTPQESKQLSSLSGSDLVDFVVSISSGPAFDAIMARLDPTQQSAFKDLVSGLITNATAVEQNTQAIQELTGSNAQSFSSSFWTNFRTAIFTGNRGLLSQYAMTIPGADVGARVMQSGALMVHAGETVRPASINRDWRGGGAGDIYNLNVTSPTQVLDPVDVNRQLAFLRKTSGR